jgi:penicillin amidase
MKIFRFVFFLFISLGLFYALEYPIQGNPPLGKLLSPHHGFLQNAEKEALELPDIISSKHLNGQVEVNFDEVLIPHIESKYHTDAYFASGYLTAHHRLWQMDFYSRLVFGRLSEVIGQRALDFDRLNRRIGLAKMTMDFHQKVMNDKELEAIVSAYTKGVNAYIDQLKPRNYPIEFKLLNYQPEPWTTEKSCMAYALLSNTLSRFENDLENTNNRMILGDSIFNVLFPEQLGNLSPIIPQGTSWPFEPIPIPRPDVQFPFSKPAKTIDKPDPLNGSNNFTVDGTKSKAGYPLFANEPDLQLTAPSIWYASHIKTPEVNVFGVTVPGTPVTLIGFNDSIAWGVTNSPRDQVDWYQVQFKDNYRREYFYNDQWFKTEKVVESFKVKGQDNFYDTIVYVHHGPVVYDRNFYGNGETLNYAMKWIAHGEATTFKAMYDLNKAQNLQDYENALEYFSGPPQNVLFASVSGDIAVRLPGKFPIKWQEQGKFLMDGSLTSHEYKALIPYDQEMYKYGSEYGFLSSANQHQVDSTYPYYVYDSHFEYYRNRRINERLSVMQNVSVQDMQKLQHDNYNYIASEILPYLLDNIDSSKLITDQLKYLPMLSDWDYFNAPDKQAPSLFELWSDFLHKYAWDEFDTMSVATTKPNTYTTHYLLRTNDSLAFWDRLNTQNIVENGKMVINDAYVAAVDSLENWISLNGEDYSWYLFKSTSVNHLLGLHPFSTKKIKIGGNHNIVNAASSNHGPSWRMVVSLNPNGVTGHGVYPGSQSGNPGNPMYGHMIDEWAEGSYFPLKLDKLSDTETQYKILFQNRK